MVLLQVDVILHVLQYLLRSSLELVVLLPELQIHHVLTDQSDSILVFHYDERCGNPFRDHQPTSKFDRQILQGQWIRFLSVIFHHFSSRFRDMSPKSISPKVLIRSIVHPSNTTVMFH